MEPAEQVATVRRFNRLVTQRAGALEDHFLGRTRPLGHSRVLYEIGSGTTDLRDLRSLLGLDSGYLSRIVQALAAEGLVEVTPVPEDERVRRVQLTPAGAEEVAEMERRSDEAAAGILHDLTAAQQERLTTAMEAVRGLLLVTALRIDAMHPDSPAARICLERYYKELASRFDDGFDPASSLPAPASELIPPRGIFLVAMVDGRPVGCGAIKGIGGDRASIKRMWVSSDARGLGVGRRILQALEEHAARLGFSTLRLETNRFLPEAIGLYRTSGYRDVPAFNDDPYADHWFEKTLGPS